MADEDDTVGNERTDYSRGARNRKVFTTGDDIFGLPSHVFMMGLVICGGTFFVLRWWHVLIAAALYFPSMMFIHKDDPRALALWRDALTQRYQGFEAGTASRRQLVLLSDDASISR